MRARMETTAGFQARSGTGASPNSSAIHCWRRVSVTSSKRKSWAAPWATSSHREAGSPEIVSNAIRYISQNSLLTRTVTQPRSRRFKDGVRDGAIAFRRQMAIIGEGLPAHMVEDAGQVQEAIAFAG